MLLPKKSLGRGPFDPIAVDSSKIKNAGGGDLAEFLGHDQTLACEERDFIEWHKGHTKYAVWAVCIENTAWHEHLHAARRLLAPFLVKNYQRQEHITVLPCGFLASDSFCASRLAAQIEQLNTTKLPAFELHLGSLNSFVSAPYFAIHDATGSLSSLRELLRPQAVEQQNPNYCPHATVGLFDDSYNTKEIASRLRAYDPPNVPPIQVKEITLLSYQTRSICGPLTTEHIVQLAD